MELGLPVPETVSAIETRWPVEDVAVGWDPSRHSAAVGRFIEVTRSARADGYRDVRVHVEQTSIDSGASADHDVSKRSVWAS
jgi:hypothetical protein